MTQQGQGMGGIFFENPGYDAPPNVGPRTGGIFDVANVSPASTFTHPVPLLQSPLVPGSIAPGGAAFTLTVNGVGFIPESIVNWNGSPRNTTFVSPTQLTAEINADDIATPGTTTYVTVTNPSPGGGVSNPVPFQVATVAVLGSLPGQTWFRSGPEGGAISVLAVDPITPTNLYAGTSGGGVFKSTNGGGSWTAINNGLLAGGYFGSGLLSNNLQITALAIDPATPTTLYAGTPGGLFKSTDGGGNWGFVAATVSGGVVVEFPIDVLAIDPTTPTTLYAGSRGVFKSTDGGGSWTAINSGLPHVLGPGVSGPPAANVSALAINPLTPTTLYAVVGPRAVIAA